MFCIEEQVPSLSAEKVVFNCAEGWLTFLMTEAWISSPKELLQTPLMLTASSVMLQQASRGCLCPARQQKVKLGPSAINPCSQRLKNNSSCHAYVHSPPL